MRGIVILPNGRFYATNVKDLTEIGRICGGFAAITHPIHLMKSLVMCVDDEAEFKASPLNSIASAFYGTQIHRNPILGTVVIVKEGADDLKSLSSDDIRNLAIALKTLGCIEIPDQSRNQNGR